MKTLMLSAILASAAMLTGFTTSQAYAGEDCCKAQPKCTQCCKDKSSCDMKDCCKDGKCTEQCKECCK